MKKEKTKIYRILCILFCVVLMFQIPSYATEDVHFSDVNENAWYAEAVSKAAKRGLINGVGDNLFAPEGTMTRAMAATILWRYEGKPKPQNEIAPVLYFVDLPAYVNIDYDLPEDQWTKAWYNDGAIWTAENGIVHGVPISGIESDMPTGYSVFFAAEKLITREQMATMLCRYVDYKGIDHSQQAALDVFADADSISDWAVESVAWCVAAGIMEGSERAEGERDLKPKDEITRAEATAMMLRLFENVIEKEA